MSNNYRMIRKEMKRVLFVLLLCPVVLSAQEKLSLDQCRKLAVEHNQQVSIAREQTAAATNLRKAAFTMMLPSAGINGTYTRTNKQFSLLENDLLLPVIPYTAIDPQTGSFNRAALQDPAVAQNTLVLNPSTGQPVTDADGNPVFQQYAYIPKEAGEFGSKNLFMLNASITQPVFTGGKIRQTYKISQYGEQAASAAEKKKTAEILYKTEGYYWQVLSVQEKVKLANDYKIMLEKLVTDLENLYQEGIITHNDLLKAKVKLNEVNLKLLKAQNGLSLAKMALCQVTGLPLETDIRLTDSLSTTLSPLTDDDYVSRALQQRAEIEMLNEGVKIAGSGVKLMKSRFMPNIGLTAGYLMTNPNPYNGMTEEFGGDWNVGLVCNIPVFHFGEKRQTLEAARHEQQVSELKLEEAREMISLQVQQAVYSYTESVKKAEMAKIALTQATENLQLTQDNFDEGMLQTRDVLEAQTMWQDAYSTYIDALTEQQLSDTKLKKVTGALGG